MDHTNIKNRRETESRQTWIIHRFVRDESGMTMGLTIIMIVLIGVMGAGLLTFVSRDLNAVVEVNQGQRAFELADAGVQAAKQQIRRDAEPEHYDVDDTSNPAYYDESCNVTGDDDDPDVSPRYPFDENWSPEAGVTRTFADGNFTVTIRWMNQLPATDAKCKAPVEAGGNPAKARYFQVISTGEYSGATRKIEAIFNTYDAGVPKAYFTPGTITVNGSSGCIKDVSLFSLGDINLPDKGKCDNGKPIQGTDLAYGNWQNEFNPVARASSLAGAGAAGTIYNKLSGRDYEGLQYPCPEDGCTNLTFPFDYTTQSGQVDEERLQFYEEEARLQGNYTEVSAKNESLSSWPEDSSYNTVVYVKFTGDQGNLKWTVPEDKDCSPRKKGILVVENADFTTQPNQALFSGSVIVRGGSYSDSGNTCFEGFANADGDITISGSTNPSNSPDLTNSPGFYTVRIWSWRELYE